METWNPVVPTPGLSWTNPPASVWKPSIPSSCKMSWMLYLSFSPIPASWSETSKCYLHPLLYSGDGFLQSQQNVFDVLYSTMKTTARVFVLCICHLHSVKTSGVFVFCVFYEDDTCPWAAETNLRPSPWPIQATRFSWWFMKSPENNTSDNEVEGASCF